MEFRTDRGEGNFAALCRVTSRSIIIVPMSAIGTSGHRASALHMSAFGGKADIGFCTAHVCF